MKITDILVRGEEEITGGGSISKYTPDTTIYNFLRTGYEEITAFFPMVKVATFPVATEYFDIPDSDEVITVLEVVALEGGNSEEFSYTAEELFFSTTRFIDFQKDLTNWILFQQNLRAYKVMTGAEFDWHQSEQNPNRIYLDDVPNGCRGFTVKYTVTQPLPETAPEKNAEADYNISEPASGFLLRYVVASLKKSEGAILKRFRPTGQAAETDGSELYSEGKRELEELRREVKERGYSTLSL